MATGLGPEKRRRSPVSDRGLWRVWLAPLIGCWFLGVVCMWMWMEAAYPTVRFVAYNALQVCILGIWVCAMRAIRVRIFELKFYCRAWERAGSRGQDAPNAPGRIADERRREKLAEIRRAILSLRIIATGITFPFFAMPLFAGIVLLGVTLVGEGGHSWWGTGFSFCLAALFVGSYYRWVVVPIPGRSRLREHRERARGESGEEE